MRVRGGALRATEWTSEAASAQVKSAVLLAGVLAGVEVTVREPHPSRDHTERMLAARGVDVYVHSTAVHLPGGQRLAPADVAVPGDPSSAAFFAALAALAAEGQLALPDVCLNPTRTGFFVALTDMGAHLPVDDERLEGGEDVGTLLAHAGRPLRGITVEAGEVPAMVDELPLLAVRGRARGGRHRGARRGRAAREGERPHRGGRRRAARRRRRRGRAPRRVRRPRPRPAPARRARLTHGDHRLAMAFGVLGAATGDRIAVDDPDCVAVSYPGFWDDLARATAGP
jgi:3-phosphoshikimate 1-carboxyvinyltransferase